MAKRSVHFLPKPQIEQMETLSERARQSLVRFANVEVAYNAIGLQLLDEWVDRHVRQFPSPNKRIMTIWGAFLGEVFRQRFNGDWAVEKFRGGSRLGILCPRDNADGLIFVPVMEQIHQRIKEGMRASLSFYYTSKAIEIKSG